MSGGEVGFLFKLWALGAITISLSLSLLWLTKRAGAPIAFNLRSLAPFKLLSLILAPFIWIATYIAGLAAAIALIPDYDFKMGTSNTMLEFRFMSVWAICFALFAGMIMSSLEAVYFAWARGRVGFPQQPRQFFWINLTTNIAVNFAPIGIAIVLPQLVFS